MGTSPVPAKIGKYEVLGVIGRGGMGVVYQAKDPVLGRLVAIKMITGAFSENPDMLKRFFREAQSLANLQHANIVTVFDLGDVAGTPYFVMEYLEGEGLDCVLANRRALNLVEKISIMIEVCNGLGYAHRRGVVHRDIKPANIMISRDGGIKIFDFGIAHAGQTTVTRTGEVLGTLRYMAPEQVNSKSTDARTDIFSAGVVLYQLITEHLPFEGDNTAATLMKIVSEPPPPLGTFLSAYPPEMEAILLRALAKNPLDRYSTAEDFALDLSQLQGQLKEEMIGREMADVAILIDQGEMYKAQGSLLRVLKFDQHHTQASKILREVQQRIQRDELSRQLQALKERAEEALASQQFERALEHVDRALGMARENGELQQLRERVCAEAERAEKLRNALQAAEAAQMQGDLDAAKQAAEAALALAPNNTQARILHRAIVRDIEERARHQQMEEYLQEANRAIQARRFTGAIEILKRAEELEPGAPQVHSLMDSAVAGQEQERQRRELEALTHDVEEALNQDDYGTACVKADEALARFPGDWNLQKLKGLAERQRQIEERKQLIDGLMAESRQMLQAQRHGELRDKLERALAQLGPDARLESLLGVVKERLHREAMERLRQERLRDARQFIEDRSYDHAIRALEAATRESGDDEEVRRLLAQARAEQAEAVQSALGQAEQETVLARRVEILEDAQLMSPQDAHVKEALLKARNLNQVISKIAVEAQRLEEEQKYEQALAKWETVRAVYQHYPRLNEIMKRLHDLREEAQADARQGWINRIERSLSRGDFEQASMLVTRAIEQFPWDTGVMALQEKAEAAARARGKAAKLMAEGRKALANQQWDSGSQAILRAFQAASMDLMIREQAVNELSQASRATIDNNWQASELILERLAEIEPGAASLPELQSRIRDRKKEETINSALNAARRQQGNGNLQGALRELDAALEAYPSDKRLTDLQAMLEEKYHQAAEAAWREESRRKKEAFIQDALSRAQQAPLLNTRVAILEEAVQAEPQEGRLKQQLIAARELRTKVSTLEAEAREMEQARRFDQALAKWEALAAVYREYPDLGRILEQARHRHQQAVIESKAECVRGVYEALAAAEYKRAGELLAQAKRAFPGDRDLPELERRIRDGLANRAHAERILEGAAKAAGKEKWRKALESYQEAATFAKSDVVVRDRVVSGLLGAAETALTLDAENAQLLMAEAARLDPASPLLAAMRARMEARKRGQAVEECMAAAQRCVSSGDWQGALRTLDGGLAKYPNEERLLERRGKIEREMRRRAEDLATRQEQERQARDQQLREQAQREEEQRLAREQRTRQIEADERTVREHVLEEARRAQAAREPSAPVEAEDYSATQIFLRGTVKAATESIKAPLMEPRVEPREEPPRFAPVAVPAADSAPVASRSPAPLNGDAANGNLEELTESALLMAERNLAAVIGPVARILVRRAAAKATSVSELYAELASKLDREDDRSAFLSKRADQGADKAAAPIAKAAPLAVDSAAAAPAGEIGQAAIDLGARKLAVFLGAIGPLVAKKEAKRASNQQEFFDLLAGHVDAKDRERFLKEVGATRDAASSARRPDGTGYMATPGERTSLNKAVAQPGPERKA